MKNKTGVLFAGLFSPLLALTIALLASHTEAKGIDAAHIQAISARALVGGTAGTPISGFVLSGPGKQSVLVRAVGPSLSGLGVSGWLADPQLSLCSGSTALASNDNWLAADASAMASAGTSALSPESKDAALIASLAPGAYTAPVSASDSSSGVALLEVYDAASSSSSSIVAASTRAYVGTGDQVLIPGFIISGSGSLRLLIRAVGPTLASLGVSDVLADPCITLFSGSTALASSDNWSDSSNAADIAAAAASVGDFPLPVGSKDAALLATLSQGAYTVVVSGAANSSGTTLVEIYSIPSAQTPDTIQTEVGFTLTEFLGIPTDRNVTLNLEANEDLQLYVEYGKSSGNYTGQTPVIAYPASTSIELKIEAPSDQSPLEANTRYFYRVRYRVPGETNFRSRDEHSFQTQRPKGQSFSFTLSADPHLDEITNTELLSLAMKNIRADLPDFHVDLGDILMSDKLAQIDPSIKVSYDAIAARAVAMRSYFAEFCHSVPFFFTLGNHEGEYGYTYNADRSSAKNSNVASWDLLARKRYFPTPVPDSFYSGDSDTRLISGKQELLEDYYAWEWGEALFIVLDPYWNTVSNPNSAPADNWRWTLGKTQYDWLKKTLQGSRARYKFVFIHALVGGLESARGGVETAQRYEWGGKNADDTDGFAAHRPGWEMPIHQLLVANRVSAVFHGHDHLYACQKLDGIVYQECPQPGTPFLSTGSQIEGLYSTGTILPDSGHLRITVSPDSARVDYVRAVLPSQETSKLHNRDVSDSYTLAPAD